MLNPPIGSRWQSPSGATYQVRGSATLHPSGAPAVICYNPAQTGGDALLIFTEDAWLTANLTANLTEIKFG